MRERVQEEHNTGKPECAELERERAGWREMEVEQVSNSERARAFASPHT